LQTMIPLLESPLDRIELLAGVVLPDSVRIVPPIHDGAPSNGIISLCEKYYREELADEHTGNVTFGYNRCGLPVVLHHNTPNSSIYLLWSRRWGNPLFPRYERHGREVI
jgi:hypothetical protein